MEDSDLLLLPVPALMEDTDDMKDTDYDYTPEDIAPYTPVPFRGKQHILNITDKVKNVMGTQTTLTIDFTNVNTKPTKHSLLILLESFKFDANSLCSPIKSHAFIRMIFYYVNLSSLDDEELAKLETHFSLFLLNAMSNSNKEGYNTIDASVELEFAMVDTYNEEVAWAFRLLVPTSRASIADLPSQVFNDEDFSYKCSICLDEYSSRTTVNTTALLA